MLISDVIGVLKQGKALRNHEIWRSRTSIANAVTGLLSGVAGVAYAFGLIHIQVDSETVQQISLGFASAYGLVNSLMHTITSKEAGLPASTEPMQDDNAPTLSPKPDTTYFG